MSFHSSRSSWGRSTAAIGCRSLTSIKYEFSKNLGVVDFRGPAAVLVVRHEHLALAVTGVVPTTQHVIVKIVSSY